MQTEYHKWWSPSLGHDMELKVYGYYGKPFIVFPCQGGRFYEYEDFQMVSTLSEFIEAGKIKLYTVDSIDHQSWANGAAHPADRARRHQDYHAYILNEVVPFIRQNCAGSTQKLGATGCSMGGYHAANFFFRLPQVFDTLIAISGLFQMKLFVGDYMDDNVYFNSPLAFLPNLEDAQQLEMFRQSKIIICTGQGAWEEPMVADARAIQHVLQAKGIPAWVDFWGHDVNHDWPWWRKMMPYFLGSLNLPGYS